MSSDDKVIGLVPPGPRDAIASFPGHWQLHIIHDNADLSAELTDEARALFTTHPYQVGSRELELLRGVRLVQQVGVGVDNIDVELAKEMGIAVCNVPDANAVSVAEYVIMASIYLLRRMGEATEALRRLENPYPALFAKGSHEVRGKKLGLVGYGKIAHEVATRAQALGMVISSASIRNRPQGELERQLGIRRLGFEELLGEVDLLSLHVPLTAETENLITARELAMMRPEAFLINAARGGIVNEHDLAVALREGVVAGAAVDVFTHEPLRQDNPLLQAPNAFLSPHSGGSTNESVIYAITESIKNVDRVLRGEEPLHCVW